MSQAPVTSDMLIGNIVREYPDAAGALMEQGMFCLGCPSAQAESLAEACMVHGLDTDTVLSAVNKRIAEKAAEKATAADEKQEEA